MERKGKSVKSWEFMRKNICYDNVEWYNRKNKEDTRGRAEMTNKIIDTMWDETPINITQEANFIWSIANKLRGSYMPDKYGDVIIPMTVIRRFECALAKTKPAVVAQYKANPSFPPKALCRISGFPFYCTSEYDLAELCNEPDLIAGNFKSYVNGFSQNVREILDQLEITKHIDKI